MSSHCKAVLSKFCWTHHSYLLNISLSKLSHWRSLIIFSLHNQRSIHWKKRCLKYCILKKCLHFKCLKSVFLYDGITEKLFAVKSMNKWHFLSNFDLYLRIIYQTSIILVWLAPWVAFWRIPKGVSSIFSFYNVEWTDINAEVLN